MDIAIGLEMFDMLGAEAAMADGQRTAVLQDPAVEQALQDPEVRRAVEKGTAHDAQQNLTDSLTDYYDEDEARAKADETITALNHVDPEQVDASPPSR